MNLVFDPFYNGARCDAKARGQLSAPSQSIKCSEGNLGFWPILGRLAVLKQRLWGRSGCLWGWWFNVQGDPGMSNGAVCRGDKSRGIL